VWPRHWAINNVRTLRKALLGPSVSRVLRAKTALIEAVVEGNGDAPIGGDLFAELESLVRSLSPELADDESAEDPVDWLLREAAERVADREAAAQQGVAHDAARALPAEAILALARVLSGPALSRYRVVSSSKPGAFYLLDVDGGDVLCTCPGFEYRGACRHARTLKAALAAGGPVPAEFEPVEGAGLG
jgi:hypothetical protein